MSILHTVQPVDCAANLGQMAVIMMRHDPLVVSKFRDRTADALLFPLRIAEEGRQQRNALARPS